MQKIYRFHFKPINYKKKKKKEVCWLCTTFNPVIRLSIIYHLRAIQPQIPVLNSSAYWEATSCVHVSPTYRPTSTITYSWTAHTVECRLLLFRVLHCTGAVTPRSVFPLYVVNGSVRLGNSESVLTQQPYLSDSSPLSNAAGRICWCCCYTCVRPALQIAVVTTTCTSLHQSTPGPSAMCSKLWELVLPVLIRTWVLDLWSARQHLLHMLQAFQRAINLDNPQQMRGRAQEELGQCSIEI